MKQALFDLGHAGCVSCKRAIEHGGRHIEGIENIEVDLASHSIIVGYLESKKDALEQLKNVVGKIGYEAVLVSDDN